jgi:ubiquinone/menaquinone biosynthesis C-methylase UbiE
MPTDYDAIAPGYDQRYRDRSYPGVARALRSLFEHAAGPVLEVGCGTAQWIAMLRACGVQALGLDLSAAMLAIARERAQGRLLRARADALPLRSALWRGVYCVHALHHFPDKGAFVAEAARLLAPGGSLAVISLDPERNEDRWVVYDYWPETRVHDLARYASDAQLRGWCEAQGLRLRTYDVAEQIDETRSASELLARGVEFKRSTSQLADLDEAAWQRGLVRLAQANRDAGETLIVRASLRLSLWVFER